MSATEQRFYDGVTAHDGAPVFRTADGSGTHMEAAPFGARGFVIRLDSDDDREQIIRLDPAAAKALGEWLLRNSDGTS